MISDTPYDMLPDPERQAEFYSGVPTKRLLAWCVDMVIIVALSAVVATLPLFIGWFFFPMIVLVISLIYRISTIAARSATPGMRLFNIELRNGDGRHLDGAEAAMHTIAYLIASAFFIPQVISIVLMLTGLRGQGLHDHLTGIVALNRST